MKRTGGIAKRGHREKPLSDGTVYFLPGVARCLWRLLHREGQVRPGQRLVLDGCCGAGALGREFHRVYREVYPEEPAPRVVYQDMARSGRRLEDEIAPGAEWDTIVLNPPWKTEAALSLWQHARSLMQPRTTLVFIINSVFFYQGADRARDLRVHAWYFLPRYVFAGSGRPLLDCGVAVLHGPGLLPPEPTGRVFLDIPREVCKGSR